MPGFFKSLFKPSPSRGKRSTRPQPLPAVYESPPPSTNQQLSVDELEDVATRLHRELDRGGLHNEQGLRDALGALGGDTDETIRNLVSLLEETQRDRESPAPPTITPFRPPHDQGGSRTDRDAKALQASRKGNSVAREVDADSGELASVIAACNTGLVRAHKLHKSKIARSKPCKNLVVGLLGLLEAQRDELVDLRAYGEGRGLPALRTLQEIYVKVQFGLEDIRNMTPDEAEEALGTLVQVLQEGPDYLIDVTLVELIIWQAEVIDPNFGAELREVLDQAVAEEAGPVTFRRAVESIIGISSALPTDVLDDEDGREAYKMIGRLLKHLQVRVAKSTNTSPTSSIHSHCGKQQTVGQRLPHPVSTAKQTPVSPVSSASSRNPSPTLPSNPAYQAYTTPTELQAAYGTGPLPGLSSVPKVKPKPEQNSDSDSESSQEVWEYHGNLLTHSALSLVLRQEKLAQADSSGQYNGDISWDDLRNAWIPNWAEKLKPWEVAEGEIGNTNPAEFTVRRKDPYGNRIGWRDGRMYYLEEPVFELRE